MEVVGLTKKLSLSIFLSRQRTKLYFGHLYDLLLHMDVKTNQVVKCISLSFRVGQSKFSEDDRHYCSY